MLELHAREGRVVEAWVRRRQRPDEARAATAVQVACRYAIQLAGMMMRPGPRCRPSDVQVD